MLTKRKGSNNRVIDNYKVLSFLTLVWTGLVKRFIKDRESSKLKVSLGKLSGRDKGESK